jgi:hypothetical protein
MQVWRELADDTSPVTVNDVSARRLAVAVLAASLAALVPFMLGAAGLGLVNGDSLRDVSRDVFGHGTGFILLFGWPITLVATICVALPAYFVLNRQLRSRLGLSHFITAGAGIGAVVMPIAWSIFWGRLDHGALWPVLGALMGAAGAITFWLVVGKDSRVAGADQGNRATGSRGP